MTIKKDIEGSVMRIALEGRLDTTTSPKLENEIKSSISGITQLNLDFTNLSYISSAGLRVLLCAQKIMNQQGKMTVYNCNADIMHVFEVTGFIDILNVAE